MTQLIHRRKFLAGFLAMPAIVHSGNLMPLRGVKMMLTIDASSYVWVSMTSVSAWYISADYTEWTPVSPVINPTIRLIER